MTEVRKIKRAACLRFPEESVGPLDAETAARVISAASDVAIVLDAQGIIRDLAVTDPRIAEEAFADLLSKPWVETVSEDSRHKVTELLATANAAGATASREINQLAGNGAIPLRFSAVRLGRLGQVVAFGQDMRESALLQQRLLQAQQAMERDYLRLRQSEARYRVLFQLAGEAVLIVDQASKKILEANPAAGQMLGQAYAALGGQSFGKLFHPDSRDAALALLADRTAAEGQPLRVRLADGREDVLVSAALFRQGASAQALVRLRGATQVAAPAGQAGQQRLLAVLARIPDAFVVAGGDLSILQANAAFLELTQLPSAEAAAGEPLARFLGRPGVDLSVLMANLREHGWVRNFASVIRTPYGAEESVDISAIAVRDNGETFYGFTLRQTQAERRGSGVAYKDLPRTAEQLAQLVGRVSLREIVGEATDAIERMCIEAALKLTSNNRALTAELLGVSRQSLYSKLHRFGIGNMEPPAAG